ncbi:hypothetical protein Q2B95_08350 [Stenotrophomonas maltophilia]|uniref:hypothetical protein n=1 Tax=Stenotrophomonas maltophilia TaxID=40324 RepID=UPI0030A7DC96
MKTKHALAVAVTLGVAAVLSYLVVGSVRDQDSIAARSVRSSDSQRSGFTGSKQALPVLRGSIEDARKKIDPTVFQPLGAKAYQILRLDDARPPGDALEYIRGLIPRSKSGDPLATFSIYLAVSDCRNYLSGAADRGPPIGTGGTSDLKNLEKTERKISECAALSAARDITEERWLETAARQGSMEAKLYYSIDSNSIIGDAGDRVSHPEKVIEWKEQSISYLKEVAGTGNVDAIARLSSAYENGIMVDQNLELAYAYALAANMVKPDSSGPALISNLESNLSARQRESGVLLSRSIYKSCCTL